MPDQGTYERFWEEVAILLFEPTKILDLFLHPTQILILEALARLGMPVSATIMERVCDGQIPVANYAYHLGRLERLGLLELVDTKPRRGAVEKFFDLRLARAE